ncbi:MAG: TolC family protein, partial [Spirochaetota bacterium]|nr:TolC family protein [Spirochaetota bacterium]
MDRGFILGFILMIGFIVVIVACGKSIKPSDESRGPIILESKEESALYKDDNITEDDYGKSTNRMNNKKIKNKTNSSNINIYSLKDLIEYTLQHSPTLKSAHKQIDSSIYAEKQADKTFQLNPKIQGMVNVYRDSPSQIKGSSYEIMYMQPLEIGGQQEGRRTIGKYKRKLSEDKLFALRMQVLAKVKYLYYNGLVLKKKWESINQVKSFYDKIVGVTREKRKERNISDPKALIIDILYNRFMNEYDKVKEELDNNLYDLKSEIYYEKSQSFDLKGKIFYDSLPYNIKELMKLAGNSRIELLQRHNALNIK